MTIEDRALELWRGFCKAEDILDTLELFQQFCQALGVEVGNSRQTYNKIKVRDFHHYMVFIVHDYISLSTYQW